MAVVLNKDKGLSCKMTEESRIIRVSSKNQITIPQKFAEVIGLGKEAECILKDNEIVIRRLVKPNEFDDYSDLILKDLIDQGLHGQELLFAFTEAKDNIKTAGQRLRKDALASIIKDTRDPDQVHAEIFGNQED